jgi:hypothetical protein
MGELGRWEPTPGRVHFGRVAAYRTTFAGHVTGNATCLVRLT